MSTSEILHKKIDLLTPKAQEYLLNYLDDLEYASAEESLIKERFELLNSKKTVLIDAKSAIINSRNRAQNDK